MMSIIGSALRKGKKPTSRHIETMNKINSTGVYENISNLHDESGNANGITAKLIIPA